MIKLKKMSSEIQVLLGNTNKIQLFYKNFIYYEVKKKYWKCIDSKCNVHMTASKPAGSYEVTKEPVQPHNHGGVSQKDFMCRLSIKKMKERVHTEYNTFAQTIFNEEIRNYSPSQLASSSSQLAYKP